MDTKKTKDVKSRVEYILEAYKISRRKLAVITNVPAGSISNVMHDKGRPTFDFLVGLATKFPEINLRWFILNEEPIFNEGMETMINPTDRILYIFQRENIPMNEFCEKTGIEISELASCLYGKTKVSKDILNKLSNGFPHINKEWLNEGTGGYDKK